jgi:hypothetical protein
MKFSEITNEDLGIEDLEIEKKSKLKELEELKKEIQKINDKIAKYKNN